ncbi:MAG: GNAT family N-acetyltransferase [Gracilimonas sp.]
MNIRKATINDLEAVLSLNQAALPHVGDIVMSDLEWFLENASRFLVAENKDEIAGFMIVLEPGLNYKSLNYIFFCNNYSDFDYVDRIVIAEKYRDQKFGTALYEELFQKSDKKIITCEVNLNPPNPDSLEFHKALGFKEVAEQLTYHGKKKVAMLVKKM